MKLTLNAKKLTYILVASFILFTGASTYGIYVLDKHLGKASKEYSSLMAQRDASEDRANDLVNISINDDLISKVSKEIDATIPKSKEQQNVLADLIHKMTDLVGIDGKYVNTIGFNGGGGGTPDQQTSGTNKDKQFSTLRYYPISLEITNVTYPQLLSLLQKFEQSPRFIKVDQVQLTPNSGGDAAKSKDTLQSVSISLRFYLRQ